jgi:hypothetical protein
MRVDDKGIGELDAVGGPALLLADPRRARVGRVDMEPGAGGMRALG